MADQASPLQQIAAGSNAVDLINENFDAASPAMLYGRDARTTTLLTWGYVGGRFGNALIANGTVVLTPSATNYVVASRTTGAVSASTLLANWDAPENVRLYKVTTGAAAVTDYEDHRQSIAGVGGSGTGDVTGPAASTDNALPRFDGAGGKTLQGSGVLVSDVDEISGYRAHRNAQTGTAYTAQASDGGKVIDLSNASAVTLTLPNNLPVGWCCTLVQAGAGQVTCSAAVGATLRNRQGHAKLAGRWAMATLHVRANAGGTAAEYVLCGDTAA